MTLKEKVGQMIGLAFSGTDYNEDLKYQVEEIGVGLIIYFKDNCANPEQIFNLNKENAIYKAAHEQIEGTFIKE